MQTKSKWILPDSKIKAGANQTGGKWDASFINNLKVFRTKPDKDYRLRIMPPTWENPDGLAYKPFKHFGIGPDNQAYWCLDKMKGERCPICIEAAESRKAGQAEIAKSLSCGQRSLFWIIDRDNEAEGPMIWEASWSMERDLSALSVEKRTGEILHIYEPDDGFDIEFAVEKKGKDAKGKVFPQIVGLKIARTSTPLAEDIKEQDAWLDFVQQNPLPDVLLFWDFDHIEKTLMGAKPKEEEPAQERQQTRSERSSRTREPEPESRRPLSNFAKEPEIDEVITDPDEPLDEPRQPVRERSREREAPREPQREVRQPREVRRPREVGND